MSNEVAVRANSFIASTDDYYAALAAEASTYRGGGGGVMFLKFNGNDGYYSYGADDIDLPLGYQAAMNPRSFKRGWICWKGGQVQEEIMLAIEEGTPPPNDRSLPDYGPYGKDDGWSQQKTIEFKSIDGSALNLLFQANNKSKMNALEAVMKDFARQYKSYPGSVPIVEFGENEFETQPRNEDGSKGRKVRKHAPVFKIVGWMTEEELAELSEGAPEDYAEEDAPALEDHSGEGEAEGYAEEAAPEADPEPPAEPRRGGRREAPAAAPTQRAPASRPAAPAGRAAPAAPQPAAPAGRAAPARPAPAAPAGAAPAARGRRF